MTHDVYPDIADSSHASQRAAEFFHGYFTDKSRHDVDAWLGHFHPTDACYYDATLGWGAGSRSAMDEMLHQVVSNWPENAKSYPLRILGDTTSAVVVFYDSPELFGAELRIVAAFDFQDGKVTRQIDYWDGRRNSAIELRGPDNQYPHGLGLEGVEETVAREMGETAGQLNDALAAGDARAAAALFSTDAVFEDMTTRTRVEGRLAIGRYLGRALPELPYGHGTTLRHVLGGARGGGYEWQAVGGPVRDGITALELDDGGAITLLTAVWDASRMDDSAMRSLARLSIED
jgi:ketosteroid isomerase-like protein